MKIGGETQEAAQDDIRTFVKRLKVIPIPPHHRNGHLLLRPVANLGQKVQVIIDMQLGRESIVINTKYYLTSVMEPLAGFSL
jgi:hypothetical protein